MTFKDRLLMCRDCNRGFMFSAGEQEFYSAKKLANEPRRCADCRVLINARKKGSNIVVTELKCAECGMPTRVPFEPKGHRPVYCTPCFRGKKAGKVLERAAV
ncbi:MAG TPA: zinc-ribbon domain containing protein [Candidatus Obscuribacterales bacterium]